MRIAELRSILIADSATIRLYPALAEAFPGTCSKDSPASVKLTVVQGLVGRVPRRLSLGPGSPHDLHQLEVDRFCRGHQLIADRAFTSSATTSTATITRSGAIRSSTTRVQSSSN
jgi:hypothetical protein